jgi:sugar-phosphatase
MPIKAIIFDMDGLLVNTEPMWKQAEIEVFGKVGHVLTEDDCRQTMGMRIDEVVNHWFNIKPWDGFTRKEITDAIMDRMEALIRENGEAMSGAIETIEACKSAGYKVAIASSSHERLIDSVMDKLELNELIGVRCSAQNESFGKPHPAVFLTAAAWMNVLPTECLVFEDALHGVIAAKAARMFCIAVPDENDISDPRFAIADLTIKSLKDFNLSMIPQN